MSRPEHNRPDTADAAGQTAAAGANGARRGRMPRSLATILSAAMTLHCTFGLVTEADAIEFTDGATKAGTRAMGDAVTAAI